MKLFKYISIYNIQSTLGEKFSDAAVAIAVEVFFPPALGNFPSFLEIWTLCRGMMEKLVTEAQAPE